MSITWIFFLVMTGSVLFMIVAAIWAELEEQHTLYEEEDENDD